MKRVSFFQSIRLKIIIILVLLILLAIQIIGVSFAGRLEDNLKENFESSVEERLQTMKFYLEEALAKERSENDEGPTLQQEVQQILNNRDRGSQVVFNDLQVIDKNYRVLGAMYQSDGSGNIVGKRIVENPYVTKGMILQEPQRETKYDSSSQDRVQVRVVPLFVEGELVGTIYAEASMESIYNQMSDINGIFATGTGVAIGISTLLGILVALTITKPITEMRKQAQIMSTGDFSQKVNVYGTDEIGQLAVTFNEMNDKLRLAHLTTEGERRKLSSILSNMSDGVIATDRFGAVTLMNEPAETLIGKRFFDVKGKQLVEVLQLEEKAIKQLDVQETGSVILDFSDEEEFFLIRANFSIVQDEDNLMNGYITVISDVTEQEKVERERREFVTNVSHELRTPLTTMRSYIEALADGAWKDEEIAPRFLEVTQNETDRMIRLVNDLLQLSKMDSKNSNLYVEKVNFKPFFDNIIDRFEMNKSEDIIFERRLPKEDVFAWVDKDKVTQVIDNIISNGLKYSPEGGKMKFKMIKDRQRLKVSITDQGPGIPKEKLDKIFERFYRADRARSRKLGGTGLGLAIAKEIIEAHNGEIWAESKEGKGTTVLFTLPLMKKKRGLEE